MNRFFDIIIPRFITENVAVIKIEGSFFVVCHEDDIEDGDIYDFISEAKSFNFLGRRYFAKVAILEDQG